MFEYPEDRLFFCFLLADGDVKRFEREFSHYFDFGEVAQKRRQFSLVRKQVLAIVRERDAGCCQLRIHSDCSRDDEWQLDHVVPLATNELNKRLRRLPREGKAKVVKQSFGSNHPDNLILACKRCNAFKKHRLLGPPNTSPRFLLSRPDWQSLIERVGREMQRTEPV